MPRLLADDLKKTNAALQAHEAFNVALKHKQYSAVTVGDVNGLSIATTWAVVVPMLTNPAGIAAGESLLLAIVGQPAVAVKRTAAGWKDGVSSVAKAKSKATANAPKTPAGHALGDEVRETAVSTCRSCG